MPDPAPASFALRPAEQKDIDPMVTVHVRSFPNFFLTILGNRFLRELYRGILEDEAGIVLVCTDGSGIRGFVAGTTTPANFYGRLIRRRWFHFAIAAFSPVCRKPAIIPRLLRALRKPAEERQSAPAALLMSLAVDPNAQRHGTGRSLVRSFSTACAQRGSNRIRLTTDSLDNHSVNAFYSRCGFRLVRTFTTPEGRAMNEYLLDLGIPPLS